MKRIILALSMVALLLSCGTEPAKQSAKPKRGFEVKELVTEVPDSDQYVLMSTSRGDVKIKLYRETPLHRKNFINLVMNGYYDSDVASNDQLLVKYLAKNKDVVLGDIIATI